MPRAGARREALGRELGHARLVARVSAQDARLAAEHAAGSVASSKALIERSTALYVRSLERLARYEASQQAAVAQPRNADSGPLHPAVVSPSGPAATGFDDLAD